MLNHRMIMHIGAKKVKSSTTKLDIMVITELNARICNILVIPTNSQQSQVYSVFKMDF